MNVLKTIIVEDIPSNSRLLKEMLSSYCKVIQVVGIAENVKEAIQLITKIPPDLVFLDVELPDGNGFDVLNHFDSFAFKVIFFTGHLEYAYQAIKFHAVDYLHKPVKVDDLIDSVRHVSELIVDDNYRRKLQHANSQFRDPTRIILHEVSGFTVVETNEIIKLVASGNYTDIFLTKKRKYTYCKILKDFEGLLEYCPDFMRVHKSYLINLKYVKAYNNQGVITLIEGHTAKLGESYKSRFIDSIR